MFVTRVYLARENGRRDAEPRDATYDEVYIAHAREDGTKEEVKVDKVSPARPPLFYPARIVLIVGCQKEFLDLTDIQNRDFRYVL